MKIVFYKTFISSFDDLLPSEKIVYSFLISKSIFSIEDVFDKEGECLDEEVLSHIEYGNFVELYKITNSALSKILNMSRRNVIRINNSLIDKRYIANDNIFISKEILEKGFFELYPNNNLSSELLIFYSFLKDKSKYFGGTIDTFKMKLAEEFNTTIISIKKMLNKLYKFNLIRRTENNKLLVL